MKLNVLGFLTVLFLAGLWVWLVGELAWRSFMTRRDDE